MGFGVRDLAVNAGEVQQGIDSSRRQAVADESSRLALKGQQRADEEAQTQYDTTKKVRAASADAYAQAQEAARRANQAISTQNEPEVVPSEYGDAYRNKTTGEVFADKSKAYGVVQPQTATTLFEKEFAGKVGDVYRQAGMPELAAKLDDAMQTQTFKRYLNEAHKGISAIAMGDKSGGLTILQNLYNSQIRDGRYATYQDLGNGSTKITVTDPRTGEKKESPPIPDAELGQRAVQSFLSPEIIAKHFLDTDTKRSQITAQFNVDVAKARIESELKGNLEAQKVALQARAKILEQVNQAQLDMLAGKGTRIVMDQLGQNIMVSVPGQGVMRLGKDGLQHVAGGDFKVPADAINVSFDSIMGSLRGTSAGVAPQQTTPAAPAAPAVPPGKKLMPVEEARALVAKNPTPELVAMFEQNYGQKFQGTPAAAPKGGVSVVPSAQAAPAPAPAAPAAPAPAAPAAPRGGVKPPVNEAQVIQQLIGIKNAMKGAAENFNQSMSGAMAGLGDNASQEQRASVAQSNQQAQLQAQQAQQALQAQAKALLASLPAHRQAMVEDYVSKQ